MEWALQPTIPPPTDGPLKRKRKDGSRKRDSAMLRDEEPEAEKRDAQEAENQTRSVSPRSANAKGGSLLCTFCQTCGHVCECTVAVGYVHVAASQKRLAEQA